MASDIVGGVGGCGRQIGCASPCPCNPRPRVQCHLPAAPLHVPHVPAMLEAAHQCRLPIMPSHAPTTPEGMCHLHLPATPLTHPLQHQKSHASAICLPCPCNARRHVPPLFACHAALHVPGNARSDMPPPFDCTASLCPPQHQKLCTTSILLPHPSLPLQLLKPHATSVHLLCPLPEVTHQCCSFAVPTTPHTPCNARICVPLPLAYLAPMPLCNARTCTGLAPPPSLSLELIKLYAKLAL